MITESALIEVCQQYVDNAKIFDQRLSPEAFRSEFGCPRHDEALMWSIEKKLGIPQHRTNDFRREFLVYVNALAAENKTYHYSSNARLQEAMEAHLLEKLCTVEIKDLKGRAEDKVADDCYTQISYGALRLLLASQKPGTNY